MRIVTKLFAGFTLVIIIAAGVGLFSIIQMKKLDTADKLMYQKCTVSLEQLSIITQNFELAASNMAYCLKRYHRFLFYIS
jgi:methyl-accepting chemotaxis protein